jgi:hypothetical protein
MEYATELFYSGKGGRKFLRKLGDQVPNYTASLLSGSNFRSTLQLIVGSLISSGKKSKDIHRVFGDETP